VATILIIFLKINWPNWQILCSLYVCLRFVWRIRGGLGPPWLRHCYVQHSCAYVHPQCI